MRDMALTGAVLLALGLGCLTAVDQERLAVADGVGSPVIASARVPEDPASVFWLLADGRVVASSVEGWQHEYLFLRPPVDLAAIALWEVTALVTTEGDLWTYGGTLVGWRLEGQAPEPLQMTEVDHEPR